MPDLLKTILVLIALGIVVNFINKPVRALLKKIVRTKCIARLVLRILVAVAEHKKKFRPPGSGPQKKEWVKQQYDKWIDSCDETIDGTIDCIVAALNVKKASVKSDIQDSVEDFVDTQTDKLLETSTEETSDDDTTAVG